MTVVPVQFFQVTASAIPTLLIAVGFTGRLTEASVTAWPLGRAGRSRRVAIFCAAAVVGLFAVVGEVASLAAIMRGGADGRQAMVAGGSVLYGVLVSFALILEPIRRQNSESISRAIIGVIGGSTVAAMGVLVYVSVTV